MTPIDLMINSVRKNESADAILDEMTSLVSVGVELDKPLGLPSTSIEDEDEDPLKGIEILRDMIKEKYLDKSK